MIFTPAAAVSPSPSTRWFDRLQTLTEDARSLSLQPSVETTRQTLESNPRSEVLKLPTLAVEKSELEKWWQEFMDWATGLFPKMNFGKISLNLEPVEFAIAALIILVVVGLFYFFGAYFYHKAKVAIEQTLKTPLPQRATRVTETQIELSKALEQKQWRRAARLRWMLFLIEQNEPPSLTPHEWAIAHRDLPENFVPGYRLMFGAQEISGTEPYVHWDLFLLERQRGAKP